jgi:hypothetical protein
LSRTVKGHTIKKQKAGQRVAGDYSRELGQRVIGPDDIYAGTGMEKVGNALSKVEDALMKWQRDKDRGGRR